MGGFPTVGVLVLKGTPLCGEIASMGFEEVAQTRGVFVVAFELFGS